MPFSRPPGGAEQSVSFGGAKNMLDIQFAQLRGCDRYIEGDVWDKIPSPLQKEMMQSARTMSACRCGKKFAKAEASSIPRNAAVWSKCCARRSEGRSRMAPAF